METTWQLTLISLYWVVLVCLCIKQNMALVKEVRLPGITEKLDMLEECLGLNIIGAC